MKASSVNTILEAGLGAFYIEVLSEHDFFDENPVCNYLRVHVSVTIS